YDHGELIADSGVVPDAAGDRRVVRVELEGAHPSAGRHDPGHAQRAVPAVGPQLEQDAWRSPADRAVEDLALLVAHVDHHAAVHAEFVDHPDDVLGIAL